MVARDPVTGEIRAPVQRHCFAMESAVVRALPSRLAEMIYWHAVELVTIPRVDKSLPLFPRAFAMAPNSVELTKRLPEVGRLPEERAVIDRITAQAKWAQAK